MSIVSCSVESDSESWIVSGRRGIVLSPFRNLFWVLLMASLSVSNGKNTLQFTDANGKRKTVRLGSMSKKSAEAIRLKVEHLVTASLAKVPLDHDTALWIASIGDELAARLATVGLMPERVKSVTLSELLAQYADIVESKNKSGTRTNFLTISTDLTKFFSVTIDVRSITDENAREFLDHLCERELASATIARRLRRVRSIFAFGVKKKLLAVNPFGEISVPTVLPQERKAYVTVADTEKLIAATNPTWRTIIALARYAGLRCPSEVLTLKWSDVNFATSRMTVSSPKTERIPGKAYRVMPIFAQLRPYLDEAFELASDGEVFVIGGSNGEAYRKTAQGPNGWVNSNLRTTFTKLVRRAGLTPWPRLFHSLRASCETDLLAEFPINAVTEWMGHSETVALKHYSRIPDDVYERAAKGAAKSAASALQKALYPEADTTRHEKQETPEILTLEGFRRLVAHSDGHCQDDNVTLRGFEPRSQP
jgi:integrase